MHPCDLASASESHSAKYDNEFREPEDTNESTNHEMIWTLLEVISEHEINLCAGTCDPSQ